MIFGQPVYHLLQRHNTGSCNHTRLPHPATHKLTHALCTSYEISTTCQHRSHRCAQSFRETKHHGIDRSYQRTHRYTECDSSIEYTCTVHMNCNSTGMCQLGQRLNLGYAQHGSTTAIMRIFDAQECRSSCMFVAAIGNTHLNLMQIQHSILIDCHNIPGGTAYRRCSTQLMMVNMPLITDDKRFTPTRMCQYRRCIAHCTAGHKERSLFT